MLQGTGVVAMLHHFQPPLLLESNSDFLKMYFLNTKGIGRIGASLAIYFKFVGTSIINKPITSYNIDGMKMTLACAKRTLAL